MRLSLNTIGRLAFVRSVSTSSAKSFKGFDNKFSTANIANNSERKRKSQENVVESWVLLIISGDKSKIPQGALMSLRNLVKSAPSNYMANPKALATAFLMNALMVMPALLAAIAAPL